MKILVTGSSGHLGEALVRTLRDAGHEVVGVDLLARPFTTRVGSIVDRAFVRKCVAGVHTIFHSATLHKPHVGTHGAQQFIDVNISGTVNILEAAVEARVQAFVFTSTTSVFGDALVPLPGAPAAWITEDTVPIPKNIYGITKGAAEALCQIFYRNARLPCVVLRTSRFFPEEDDDPAARATFADENLKTNEFLYRRVDLEDVVSAHLLAADRAPALGFGRFIISATTPFLPEDMAELRTDAPRMLHRRVPGYETEYVRRGWKMTPSIDRVYVNARARAELGWQPRHNFASLLARLRDGGSVRSPLAELVGSKGYHSGN